MLRLKCTRVEKQDIGRDFLTVVPAPSKKQYACKADDEDDIVCQYKGLRPTVLHNLHASGFNTTRYTDASEAAKQHLTEKLRRQHGKKANRYLYC